MTRSKKDRTFYVAADAVGEIEAYADSSRAWAVRRRSARAFTSGCRGLRVVTEVTRRAKPVVRWRGLDGTSGERPLSELTVRERMLLFTEGPHGLEPLWLWLNERGMPFGVHSWEGVFRDGQRALRAGPDPARPGRPGPAPGVRPLRDAALGPAQFRAVHAGRAQRADGPEVRADRGGAPRFPAALRGPVVHGPAAARARLPGDDRGPVPGAGGRPEPAVDAGRRCRSRSRPRCPSWTRCSPGWRGSRRASRTLDGIGRSLAGAPRERARAPGSAAGRRPRPARVPGRGRAGRPGGPPPQPRGPGPGVRLRAAAGRRADAGLAGGPVRRPVHAGPLVRPRHVGGVVASAAAVRGVPGQPGAAAARPGRAHPGDGAAVAGEAAGGCRRLLRLRRWSAACCATTPGCRRDRSPTSWPAAAGSPRSRVQSYSEAEFDQVTAAARRRFRAALQRINDNAAAPAAMAGRRVRRGQPATGLLGEGLDILARTGDLPRNAAQGRAAGATSVARYRNALGAAWPGSGCS